MSITVALWSRLRCTISCIILLHASVWTVALPHLVDVVFWQSGEYPMTVLIVLSFSRVQKMIGYNIISCTCREFLDSLPGKFGAFCCRECKSYLCMKLTQLPSLVYWYSSYVYLGHGPCIFDSFTGNLGMAFGWPIDNNILPTLLQLCRGEAESSAVCTVRIQRGNG